MPLTSPPKTRQLTLTDGRQLGYARYGADKGIPLLYLHGLPGSRIECLLIDAPAKQLGIQVVAVDRPGYGISSPLSGPLSAWAADIEQLADHLGWQQFAVMGVSGGGPCALVCAHRLPQRITRVALIAGLGPVYEPALLHHMGRVARTAFFASRHAPQGFQCLVGRPLTRLSKMNPRLLLSVLATVNGQPDKKCLLRKDISQSFLISLPACFAQGSKGAMQDLKQFQRPWGICLKDIHTPVKLWHGNQDSVVPLSHSEYLAQQLVNAQLTVATGEGHFSLPLLHMQQLLSDFFDIETA